MSNEQPAESVRWYDLTIRFGTVNGEIVIENGVRFTEAISERVSEVLPGIRYVDSVVLRQLHNDGTPT